MTTDPPSRHQPHKERHPVDTPKDRPKGNALRITALAMQLPFMILGAYFIGGFLDDYFSVSYLRIVIILLALVGSFAQLIHEVLKDDK